jgi:hypothetical protein
LYVQQLSQIAHGLVPYRDFALSYTPLFLYALYPFYVLGGAGLAFVPIVLADAATPVAIFLVVERFAGQRLAILSALGYAFSPFTLYYEGYIWFSSQPMTLFAILATYYLLRDKPVRSLSVLAIAVLFKQEAIFLLPVFIIWLASRDARKLLASLTAFVSIATAISFPFLIISARDYLSEVSYQLLGKWRGISSPGAITSSATCQNIDSNVMGTAMSCTSGTMTYSQFVTNAGQTALLVDRIAYAVNVLSGLVAIPMLLLVIPVVFHLRKKPQFLPLILAFAGTAFLVLFSIAVHVPFKYYYVPVYAILFTVVMNKKSVAVVLAASTISLVTPSGALQELIPILAVLTVATVLDSNSQEVGKPVTDHVSQVASDS